jgi:Domain of Unknown Function (DUF748)
MPVAKLQRRRLPWVAAVIASIALAVTIGSYYVNPIIRSHIESAMNRSLVGYQTRLKSAHLRFLDGTLFLYDLDVVQVAHPKPAVILIPKLRISVQWRELFSGRIVANCLIGDPTLSINLAQLRSEKAKKTPLKQEGWQQALTSIYPFKINRFQIENGTVTYIDADPTRPIKLKHLAFSADNIRNIHEPKHPYPSTIHVDTVVFDTGHASLDGRANFLAEPVPSLLTGYSIEQVPLAPFDSAIKRVNLRISRGVVSSNGVLEYSSQIKRAEVEELKIQGIHLTYVHSPQTAPAEAQRMTEVKNDAKAVNNKPGLLLKLKQLRLVNSELTYANEDSDHRYNLFFSKLNAQVTNLSNQSSEGVSHVNLTGDFMGNGATTLVGTFRPRKQGPDFDLNLGVQAASLPSLNDLLKAYGRFDVESGNVSIYSQTAVREGEINGYVKTLFSDVKVYDYKKDTDKPVLHQAYELLVGGAAKLLRNGSSKNVATEVNLKGKLSNPSASTWEALKELIYNAFIDAIEPGFNREIGQVPETKQNAIVHRLPPSAKAK